MFKNVDQVRGCFIQYMIFKVVVVRLTLIRSGILNLHTIYIFIYIYKYIIQFTAEQPSEQRTELTVLLSGSRPPKLSVPTALNPELKI